MKLVVLSFYKDLADLPENSNTCFVAIRNVTMIIHALWNGTKSVIYYECGRKLASKRMRNDVIFPANIDRDYSASVLARNQLELYKFAVKKFKRVD